MFCVNNYGDLAKSLSVFRFPSLRHVTEDPRERGGPLRAYVGLAARPASSETGTEEKEKRRGSADFAAGSLRRGFSGGTWEELQSRGSP